jgi:adenylate cyclase class 2
VLEIEVKFPVDDFSDYRDRLLKLNAQGGSSFFEDNVVFDDKQGSLRRTRKLLRLRKSDRTTLTFKSPAKKVNSTGSSEIRFKIMEEHEIEISSFETALKIIEGLGYEKSFRYQKNREQYTLGDTLVLLDETPIGNFIEIEGDSERIREICEALRLELREGISLNYMELYVEYCEKKGIEPSDMVFARPDEA